MRWELRKDPEANEFLITMYRQIIDSSHVERNVCVLNSGMARKLVYFCSGRILVVIISNDLSTLLAFFIFDILSINTCNDLVLTLLVLI